jgi:hypothetical protein
MLGEHHSHYDCPPVRQPVVGTRVARRQFTHVWRERSAPTDAVPAGPVSRCDVVPVNSQAGG